MKNQKKRIFICVLIVLQLLTGALVLRSSAMTEGFPDVRPGEWYYENVTAMAAEGVLAGYPDGTFQPNRKITGAEFVNIVCRRKGLEPVPGQTDHWAAERMQAALDRGWYDWDEFPPTAENYDQPVSRQLAVKVLMKAFLPDARGDYNTESAKMTDFDQLDGRYYEPVLAAYATGMVVGDVKGTFRPKDGLSRAEACALIRRAAKATGEPAPGTTPAPGATPAPEEPVQPEVVRKGGISENGWLQVKGTQLCNEKGEPVVLRGMSTHGLQWFPQFANEHSVKTVGDAGANLIRLAMYTGENGYISQPPIMKKRVIDAAELAIKNDMYVIIDWHILSDGDPRTHQDEALKFFDEMARKYKDQPGVLFEICNEPNGGVFWKKDVKPYAEAVIDTIRSAGAKNVILVGSSSWSQDIHFVVDDPIDGENLMYSLHFYAGTHGQYLRDRIDRVMMQNLPIFVTEWGASRADGSGGVFPEETAQWMDYLDSRKISWANWSLCDKDETSAALKPGADPNTWTIADLSESGKLVFDRF